MIVRNLGFVSPSALGPCLFGYGLAKDRPADCTSWDRVASRDGTSDCYRCKRPDGTIYWPVEGAQVPVCGAYNVVQPGGQMPCPPGQIAARGKNPYNKNCYACVICPSGYAQHPSGQKPAGAPSACEKAPYSWTYEGPPGHETVCSKCVLDHSSYKPVWPPQMICSDADIQAGFRPYDINNPGCPSGQQLEWRNGCVRCIEPQVPTPKIFHLVSPDIVVPQPSSAPLPGQPGYQTPTFQTGDREAPVIPPVVPPIVVPPVVPPIVPPVVPPIVPPDESVQAGIGWGGGLLLAGLAIGLAFLFKDDNKKGNEFRGRRNNAV